MEHEEPFVSLQSYMVEDLTLKAAFLLCHPNPGISQLAQRDYAWSLVTLLILQNFDEMLKLYTCCILLQFPDPEIPKPHLQELEYHFVRASGAPNSISCFMMVFGRSSVFHFHPFSACSRRSI